LKGREMNKQERKSFSLKEKRTSEIKKIINEKG